MVFVLDSCTSGDLLEADVQVVPHDLAARASRLGLEAEEALRVVLGEHEPVFVRHSASLLVHRSRGVDPVEGPWTHRLPSRHPLEEREHGPRGAEIPEVLLDLRHQDVAIAVVVGGRDDLVDARCAMWVHVVEHPFGDLHQPSADFGVEVAAEACEQGRHRVILRDLDEGLCRDGWVLLLIPVHGTDHVEDPDGCWHFAAADAPREARERMHRGLDPVSFPLCQELLEGWSLLVRHGVCPPAYLVCIWTLPFFL